MNPFKLKMVRHLSFGKLQNFSCAVRGYQATIKVMFIICLVVKEQACELYWYVKNVE